MNSVCVPHLSTQERVETEGESDDEEGANERKFEERLEHVREHDHVNPEIRKLANVRE